MVVIIVIKQNGFCIKKFDVKGDVYGKNYTFNDSQLFTFAQKVKNFGKCF